LTLNPTIVQPLLKLAVYRRLAPVPTVGVVGTGEIGVGVATLVGEGSVALLDGKVFTLVGLAVLELLPSI